MNIPVGNYCADLPEQKEMFWVKYGNKTNETFPRCHVERVRLGPYSKSKNRKLEETLGLLSFYQQNMNSSKEEKKIALLNPWKKDSSWIKFSCGLYTPNGTGAEHISICRLPSYQRWTFMTYYQSNHCTHFISGYKKWYSNVSLIVWELVKIIQILRAKKYVRRDSLQALGRHYWKIWTCL